MKRMLMFLVLTTAASLRADESKIPAHCLGQSSFLPLPETCVDSEGHEVKTHLRDRAAYARIHPSGDYAIVSGGGGVFVLDLSDWKKEWSQANGGKPSAQKIPCLATPLSAEAYPVEPDWDLVSSHDLGAMNYYRFEDLLANKDKAKSILKDEEHNEYYQSHAVTHKDKSVLEFDTVFYSDLTKRHYRLTYGADGKLQSQGPDSLGTVTNLDPKSRFQAYATPILSKDGKFIALNSRDLEEKRPSSQKIYALDEKNKLTLVADVGYSTGKASFAYPKPGTTSAPQIAFTALEATVPRPNSKAPLSTSYVGIFDPATRHARLASFPWLESSPSSPNFTKDGELLYIAKRDGAMGLVATRPEIFPAAAKNSGDQYDDYADCFEYFDQSAKKRVIQAIVPLDQFDRPGHRRHNDSDDLLHKPQDRSRATTPKENN